MGMCRPLQGLGCLSCISSRPTVSEQQRIWVNHGISVEFTVLKHRLNDVKEQFLADGYYHIGDTEADHRASLQAGFDFLPVDNSVIQWLNGLAPQ